MTGRSFLFLLASARHGGNTEALARHAASQLPSEVEQRWLRLDELPLPLFRDVRHEGEGAYPVPTGAERLLLDATLDATDLVIASPVYWYSVSAAAKLYLDYWAGWLRVPGVHFKARMRGRSMWAVGAHTSADAASIEPFRATLRLSAEYLGMRWRGALLAYANRPGQVLADEDALRRAAEFFPPDR
ncbi:NAD(P)H-dependent oxidoreductase [Micromonospora arborensis]|uniref:flavodoxin family protein n=1 Tax=Micromonospora arborensis TaxID=2116518 RepID=UPI0033E0F61F